MRKISVLGALALLMVGATAGPAVALTVTADTTTVLAGNTCPEAGKIDTTGDPKSVTVTADGDDLITSYCVKAGASNQGDGPLLVTLDEPVSEVVITYPGGKAISHYAVYTQDSPAPTPSPSTSVSPSPSTSASSSASPSPLVSTSPSASPSGAANPTATPSTAVAGATNTADGDPAVLAATGAAGVAGVSLIALALAGWGVTLLVLRRRRLS